MCLVAVLGESNVKVREYGRIFIRNPPGGFPRAVEKAKVEKAKVERKGMNEIVAYLNEIESQSRPEGGKLLDLLPMDSDLLDSEEDDRENISTNIFEKSKLSSFLFEPRNERRKLLK